MKVGYDQRQEETLGDVIRDDSNLDLVA